MGRIYFAICVTISMQGYLLNCYSWWANRQHTSGLPTRYGPSATIAIWASFYFSLFWALHSPEAFYSYCCTAKALSELATMLTTSHRWLKRCDCALLPVLYGAVHFTEVVTCIHFYCNLFFCVHFHMLDYRTFIIYCVVKIYVSVAEHWFFMSMIWFVKKWLRRTMEVF